MTLPSSDPNDVSSFPAVGEVIEGKYEIREVIGTGGMAAVAKANHVLRRAPVALKFMSAHVAAVPGAVDRFVNEAVAASQIESEHVVKVFDVCRLPNGAPYLVMEYLDGVDLAGLLERDGRPGLAVPRAIHVTLQVLRALEVAHRSGIVHRDVKPSNCFVIKRDGDPDFVKLLDFGISKLQHPNGLVLTGKSETLGTPLYMSPEQAHSPGNVDARTDLYSVGVVLYELLAGRTPFEANNITLAEHLFRLFTTDPPPISLFCPKLPPGLAETVHHALMRDPQQRITTASEFAARIVPFADERSLPLLMRFGPQVYRPGTALSVTIQDAPADPMVYTMSEATAETMPPPGAVTLAASQAYGMGPAATAQRPMAASASSTASPVSASPVSLGSRGASAASNAAASSGSAAQGRGDLAASKATPPPASSAKVAVPLTNAGVRTTRDARPLVRTGLAVHPRPPARFEEVLAKEATKGSADLPKLPKLVRDVMNLARRNDVDFKEVTKLAETEPTLASRILTVANSAVYSRGVRLTDIKKSLIRIGGQTTKEILYQTAYAKSFEVPLFQPYVDASFVHAVIVAKLVRRLGELKGEDPDNAYIAGLFHDVGRPYCFKLAAQNPSSVPGNIEELVRLIDANHETAGDLLLQRWRLPAPIAEACRAHHQPAVSGLSAMIQLADTVARHLEKPARSSLEDIFGAMKLLELEDVWAGRLMTMAGDTEDAVPFPKGP